MTAISIQNLSFAYPGSYDEVFTNLNLHWDSSWRLGLIGRNGRGKTTLLRLLQNQYDYQGTITAPLPFRYFPIKIDQPTLTGQELASIFAPEHQPWQLENELSRLEVSPEVLMRPYHSLSGGEQSKLQLAMLFLDEKYFPLIDEPTNHLDLYGRTLLANYLRRKPGFLLVSHDRALLDGAVDHIIAIDRNQVTVTAGNYSTWRQNKDRQDQFELAENERLKKEISHLDAAAKRTAKWSDQLESSKRGALVSGIKADKGYIGAQAARVMKRSKATEQRQQQAIEEKSKLLHNLERSELLPIRNFAHHAQTLVELKDLSIAYGQNTLLEKLSLQVQQGDRLAISGKNGSGKSSLLKLIAGFDIPHQGTVRVASQLKISYLPQQSHDLQHSMKELIQRYDLDESLFKTILRKLDFARVQFEKDLSALSEGQKKKVLLAKCLAEPAQLYIWDEPLNYIDLFSRDQIEEVLLLAQPTMIFVEHDKTFVSRVATRSLDLG